MNFLQWRMSKQKLVEVQSWLSHHELKLNLADYLEKNPPRPNHCYDNAMRLCQDIPGVRYVLGRVTGDGVTVDHAWNEYHGIHFDVTREWFAPETLEFFMWHQFELVDASALAKLSTFGIAPDVYDVFHAVHAMESY